MDLVSKLIKKSGFYWKQYMEHEFPKLIANGKLNKKKFDNYLKQDTHYLFEYIKSFFSLGLEAKTWKDLQFASECVKKSIGEQQLFSNNDNHPSKPNYACKQYIQYLNKIANTGDFIEILISIAPCYIGYHLLAKNLVLENNIDKKYLKWVQLYSGSEYENEVNDIINKINTYSEITNDKYLKLQKIFDESTMLEIQFFESAL